MNRLNRQCNAVENITVNVADAVMYIVNLGASGKRYTQGGADINIDISPSLTIRFSKRHSIGESKRIINPFGLCLIHTE
jgi:hypothetical protein